MRIIGITIAHPPAQSLNLRWTHYEPEIPTDAKWVKIITWRANGDGFGLKGNAYMEDCFIRAADDSTYVGGRGMKRIVIWNDSNGASFVLSHIGSERINTHPVIVEDCSVIYARSHFAAGKEMINSGLGILKINTFLLILSCRG